MRIQHPGPGAANRFRRFSFRGFNKCNVFALDVAWRSGFHVPLLNIAGSRSQAVYSYPLANMLTTYAERVFGSTDNSLRGSNGTQWGLIRTSIPAAQINDEISRGGLYILVGWRRSGTGHVGIISRIRSKTDDTGRIRDITYDGWEATGRRAEQLAERHWRTDRCSRVTGQCQRDPGDQMRAFCAIHIIGLLPETHETRRGVLTGATNRCTLR